MNIKIRCFVLMIVISLIMDACSQTVEVSPTESAPKSPTPGAAAEVTQSKEPEATATSSATPVSRPAITLSCSEPVKIGLVSDRSGPLAIYGSQVVQGFTLGMEFLATEATNETQFRVDQCDIEVIVADDRSDANLETNLANELILGEGVDILVGTITTAGTKALQTAAKESGIPLIVAPAGANDITGVEFNEYTFRVSRTNYQDAMNLCAYLPLKHEKIIQVAPDTNIGWGAAAAYREACSAMGAEFVAPDMFLPADTQDFSSAMPKVLGARADAWIVTWPGSGMIALLQAAREAGVLDRVALGTSFLDNSTLPALFGNAVGTTGDILYHYSLPQNPINDWLVKTTQAKYGVLPDLFHADGMNAALMIVQALEASGGNTDGKALVEAMEGLEFEGPKGKIFIRPEDHVAIQDLYIVRLDNVSDPEFRFLNLLATNRPEPPCLLPENLKARCGALPYGRISPQP